MRLLNVETKKMEEFFDEIVPPYAILSHRWGGQEVSLQEWLRVEELEDKIFRITRQPAFGFGSLRLCQLHITLRKRYDKFATEKGMITSKSGYSKILSCCKLVRRQSIYVESQDHPCRYVWIDTCCIDKTNNAELSEAINSMFRWYQKSLVCLVHLADVHTDLGQKEIEDEFRNSTWFKRGWTLQELLASSVIKFFDQEWEYLFDREHKARLISDITRIDEDILTRPKRLSDICSAEKMSWASSRTTTRKEDMVYCLLGIFDFNMPLLYGEGDKAFVRLQEEIISQSGDLSIFAWGYNMPMVYERGGIFAHSPADFIGCSELSRRHNRMAVMSMTNVLLSVQLRYCRPNSVARDFIYADLDCSAPGQESIYLPLINGDSHFNLSPTFSAGDVTSLWFERRGGARPILINEMKGSHLHWVGHDWRVQESGTISILKKDSVPELYFGEIFIGLNVPASQCISDEDSSQGRNKAPLQVVLEEVCPPHVLGKNAVILDVEGIGEQKFWYLESAEETPDHREYGHVSYLRISCWNSNSKRSEMVVVVRRSERYDSESSDSETDFEVRLSEWPHPGCASLADYAFRGHARDENTEGMSILGPGVKQKAFGDFIVKHSGNYILIFAPGEANGESGKETEGSEGRSEEGMVEEAEGRFLEETGSDWSENSGDLGVHGLFNHSRSKMTGSPSRNATRISLTNASDHETRDAGDESGGNQRDRKGGGKNEENSDYLGITGLFN